jgi:hypothetical protein
MGLEEVTLGQVEVGNMSQGGSVGLMYTYCLLKGVRDAELFICYGASIDRAE